MSLLGPLARWELVRLGRGGSLQRVRAGLVLALLGGLAIAYYGAIDGPSASVTIAQVTRVAQNYLYAYLAVQALAVVVLTPVIAAGAIADEKERGRLDFLRSTELSPRDIVLGKYVARVLHLFAILAAGVPVLALATLFGGVDIPLLIAGTLSTVTGVMWVAAYGLWLGIKRANLREAALVAYLNLTGLTVAGLVCGSIPGVSALSPLSATAYLVTFREQTVFWVNAAAVAGCQLVAAAAFLVLSVKDFAQLSGDPPSRDGPPPPLPPGLAEPRPYYEILAAARAERKNILRTGDDPFAWREKHFAPKYAAGVSETARGCALVAVAATIFPVGVFLVSSLFFSFNVADRRVGGFESPLNDLVRGLTAAGAGLVMVLLSTRAATSVAGEVERQTLTPLLMLPVERGHLLRVKWDAVVGWLRYVLIVTVVVEVLGLAGRATPLLAALLVPAQVGSAGLLAATLGLWLSVSCATATRAAIWSVAVLLTLAVVPLLLTPLAPTRFAGAAIAALSPPAGVWLTHTTPAAGVLPLATQLLAAWLLWRSARRQFENLGR
jgi:ABC-type transport system involved in multi-copper enzyme maturation permease subunit